MSDPESAAASAALAFEQALQRATRTAESDLARIIGAGEQGVDRLVRRLAEQIAALGLDAVLGPERAPRAPLEDGPQPVSFSDLATAIARAAQRGARFR